MQTIIVLLDSRKMENPDLDVISLLPVRVEEVTDNKVYDNGFDYINDDVIGVWLETENADEGVKSVIELIKTEKFADNDLSKTAEILVSVEDCAEIEKCRKVFPE
ncbi:MAG: hypothetical protein K6F71_14280 [Ruminococcus sp.]|uniref:hypothetical protein n=1 Tax=Ruminococcus sp. TaxID=41978 RepID=UPI0025E48979|nr:hypothetical protein [Ruminococcus sp.]MCR5541970.1 hypothetical protein [Ruminococcus sp.]